MSKEALPNNPQNYQEYLENKAEYSASGLSHHFNSELGIASNLLGVLRRRIESLSISDDDKETLVSRINNASLHLAAAHEIAHATFDLLLAKENPKD